MWMKFNLQINLLSLVVEQQPGKMMTNKIIDNDFESVRLREEEDEEHKRNESSSE